MTRVTFKFSDNEIYCECENHAGDHDICTICSTLCNVLVCENMRYGINPIIYEPAHVVILGDERQKEVFIAVLETFRVLSETSDCVGVKVQGNIR